MHRVLASCVAVTALALATSAGAVMIPRAPILGPVSVRGDVAISYLYYSQTLLAPGTLYLDPPIFVPEANALSPGCDAAGYCDVGTGVISATVGHDPTIELGASPINGGGGDSDLDMSYQVEYFNPHVAIGTPERVRVIAGDQITQLGFSAAEAIMTVAGPNGTVYSAYNCSAAPGAAFACETGTPNAPFADQTVTLLANEAYTVDLAINIYSHGDVEASIDPQFTAPADEGGSFDFSPGITSGVPEPATWVLFTLGFGGLGSLLRWSRKTLGQGRAPGARERQVARVGA